MSDDADGAELYNEHEHTMNQQPVEAEEAAPTADSQAVANKEQRSSEMNQTSIKESRRSFDDAVDTALPSSVSPTSISFPASSGSQDSARAPSTTREDDPDNKVKQAENLESGSTSPPYTGTSTSSLSANLGPPVTSAIYSSDAPRPALIQPVHRNSHTSITSSSADSSNPPPKTTVIHGVVLVGFNHSLGPIVEYASPASLGQLDAVVKNLPFLSLPDGAHLREEDYSCFHLYLPDVSTETVYGISCIRQLRSEDLIRRSSDVTRSTVQKAVVVLANKPIFGPIRDKLGVITRAFFAQKDFHDTQILDSFHKSLEYAMQDEDQTSEAAIYMGMSLRELVWKFRLQTLILFKLLLLQRKVMFFGTQVERLCAFQYSLVSLVPLLLLSLDDAASPVLDTRANVVSKPSSLKTSDRKSLLSYIGLPLNLFGKDAFFQPYLPLQQLELLQSKSYLVGTSNSIFQSQRDCQIDVIVNVDTANLEFRDPKIASLVNLTPADRKWMDDIVRTIETTWNPQDPHRPLGMGFRASDDWLRSKFEEYVCSALSALKFIDYLRENKDAAVLINNYDPTGLSSFNEAWTNAIRQTSAFKLWDAHTDPVIFDLVEPRHPCEGQAHLIDDVGIRLTNSLHDLHLDERLAPAQEAITKGIATGSEGFWKAYSSIKTDIARRQADFQAKKDEQDAPAANGSKDLAQTNPQQLLSTHVIAGAAEVGGRAASLATSFGSFLGSKIGKAKAESTVNSPIDTEKSASSKANAASQMTGVTLTSPATETDKPEKSSFFAAFKSVASPSPNPGLAPSDPRTPPMPSGPTSANANLSPSILTSFWGRRTSANALTTPKGTVTSAGDDVKLSWQDKSASGSDSTYPPSGRNAIAQATSVDELPEGFAEANAAWAKAQADFDAQQSKRNSTSGRSDRSSFEILSDVKL